MISKLFTLIQRTFKPYNNLEISLKILSMILGVAYVFYAYFIGTGLGTMVPRYAGY